MRAKGATRRQALAILVADKLLAALMGQPFSCLLVQQFFQLCKAGERGHRIQELF